MQNPKDSFDLSGSEHRSDRLLSRIATHVMTLAQVRGLWMAVSYTRNPAPSTKQNHRSPLTDHLFPLTFSL
jgi:hypothetical protein